MSRVLPPRANLDHLRNQARRRLRDLQRRSPSATLADAQHVVAREYGFASWPKLKKHVESLVQPDDARHDPAAPSPSTGSDHGGGDGGGHAVPPDAGQPPSDYGFMRYSHKAREATFFSRFEAATAGAPAIEPEHLLLGLIRAAQGTRSRIFERMSLPLDDARAAVARERPAAASLGRHVHIPFSDAARRILRHAVEEADRVGHQDIRIVHLLLGILCEPATIAAAIVERRGVRRDTLRAEIDGLLPEEPI